MLSLGVIFLVLVLLIIAYYAITIPVERSFGERYVVRNFH